MIPVVPETITHSETHADTDSDDLSLRDPREDETRRDETQPRQDEPNRDETRQDKTVSAAYWHRGMEMQCLTQTAEVRVNAVAQKTLNSIRSAAVRISVSVRDWKSSPTTAPLAVHTVRSAEHSSPDPDHNHNRTPGHKSRPRVSSHQGWTPSVRPIETNLIVRPPFLLPDSHQDRHSSDTRDPVERGAGPPSPHHVTSRHVTARHGTSDSRRSAEGVGARPNEVTVDSIVYWRRGKQVECLIPSAVTTV